jgi:hypothetical protein
VAPLIGKISQFGGPGDSTAGTRTASGAPTSAPGIAVLNQATLGGYWLMVMPNGHVAIVKQTDIGPATWTGRKFDFTYSILPALGYTTGNFPTDGKAAGVYLGKGISAVAKNVASAIGQLGIGSQVKAPASLSQLQSQGVQVIGGAGVGPNVGGGLGGAINTGTGAISGAVSSAADVAGQVGKIAELLTSTQFWLRLGEAIGGIILLAIGLRALVGGPSLTQIAGTAAKVVK